MDSSVLQTLEYNKVRAMLADKTSSVMGRELAEALIPTNDISLVRRQIDETAEAREIMAVATNVPLGGIRDIRAIIKRADLGAVLEPYELLAVGSTLYAARRMKTFFNELPKPVPLLSDLANNITVQRNIENIIESTISEQGSIRDDASVELARIRREIKMAQSRVKDKIDAILRSSEYQKYFQDVLVTMRGDRYVIPIKQEYRHNFPGIVHDQSASGATVFIEPMAVVNLNNDIKQLMAAEKNEIERILLMVSAHIGKAVSEITLTCQMLAQLDFAFAKANLSFDMRAQQPNINNKAYVNLQRARHPLIPGEVVVPIDVHIGKDFNTLLITGPNTGGKTVTLKTLGLFALMTQSGLFIPAASGSDMPVFNNIFSDIGDEQSIEQSLSTFSAHMTNLVRILRKVSSKDLVLIDEIGAGTDPDEGAALAMAILEYLLDIGSMTIATTHYSELKTFAFSRHGIENASVEFDIQTLKPTYRLLIGVPGSSNAFAISRRLGLEDKIINRARQLIDKDHAELETVLTSLEEQKLTYVKRNEEVTALEQQLSELRQKLTQEQETFALKKNQMISKAQEDAAMLLRQARREAEEIIAELKVQFSAQNVQERQRAITGARRRLRDNIDKLNITEENDSPLPPVKAETLRQGTSVYVTTLNQKGTVLMVNGDEVTVQLGIMKVNVPLSACRLAEEPERKIPKSNAGANLGKIKAVPRQVDIRGMTVDEAENVLEKYLDDAIMAGLNEVIVIHGKGTGALRKGVRIFLKNHHHVRDISIGEVNEGGDGATVVRLS